MGEPKRDHLKVEAKRAVLVGIIPAHHHLEKEQALNELAGLAKTAGCEIVDRLVQVRRTPDPATYLGRGKVEELRQLMRSHHADLAIFDNALSPSQGKNLETQLDAIVVDRSEVILDIFATHAQTYEAKLQVELAQLLYMRPRLKRMWTHLERIEGGIGSARGPGEKQLELDRRLLDQRVSELKKKLGAVERRRERLVSTRDGQFTVSLVGYTNAGKSTLMRALTGSDTYIADQLFATLDTKTKRWDIADWGTILLSDTVGFVRNLPHHLVASFKSTLEEARQADLLLHVVDASDPEVSHHIQTVETVLSEIGMEQARKILVLNKIDQLHDRTAYDIIRQQHRDSISVSAVTGEGLDHLTQQVCDVLTGHYCQVDIKTTAGAGRLEHYLREHAILGPIHYADDNTVSYSCRISAGALAQVRREFTSSILSIMTENGQDHGLHQHFLKSAP